MDYQEYKKASERHLDTCLSLKRIIEDKYENKILNPILELEKQEHLFNLYYLSGYIIECRMNYSILEFINFKNIATHNRLNSCKQLKSFHLANPYKVSFSSRKDNNANYYLWRPQHKFQSNIDFFAAGSKLAGIGHIRGVNGNQITPHATNQLFQDWDVEYRYETKNQNLSSQEIFEFLDFANEVLTGLENLGY
jgi:hypothetical protein